MRFDVLTVLPSMFQGPFDVSILKRAVDLGLLSVRVHDIRAYSHDRHHTTDDYPFGGGAGMVMKAGPILEAVEALRAQAVTDGLSGDMDVIMLTPQGRPFTQRIAEELSTRRHIVLICGHYEGVDERVYERVVTDEISIGDYVLTGGELPAMVLVDAVSRLVPGVLGAAESLAEESISSGLLEYPQYTRPAKLDGMAVPNVLLSGDHQAIARWRRMMSLQRTFYRRPDLLVRATLTRSDAEVLSSIAKLSDKA